MMLSGSAKHVAKNICDVFPYLSDAKKEWLLGFGEGISFAKNSLSLPEAHPQVQTKEDFKHCDDAKK